MAINKEYLKRRNAKRVFEKNKNNTRKSTDFSFNNAQISSGTTINNNISGTNDSDKTSAKSSINKKALRTNRIRNQYKKDQIAKRIISENQNESQNETSADETLETFGNMGRSSVGYASKSIKATSKKYSKTKSSESVGYKSESITNEASEGLSEYKNISKKSKMFSSEKVSEPKAKIRKKAINKKNRKKVFANNQKQLYKKLAKAAGTEKIKKQSAKVVGKLLGKLAIGILGLVLIGVILFAPIIIIVSIAGGETMSQAEMQIAYAYPASDVDITKAIEFWQMLEVSLKANHKDVPNKEGIAGHFDEKKSSVCEIMNDNNQLLSFLSAYYIPYVDTWRFEDARDLIQEVFTKMYSITYFLESETKIQTSTKIIPESALPSPLPNNYTILSQNGSDYVVKISETQNITVLDYRIVENMTWEDILNEYLDKDQREKYQNYYDLKGGAIKAFSSPFAFAWEGYITSPFGYRVWDDGSAEYHKGVDFGVPHGTEELAVADGTVVKMCNTCTHDYSKNSSCGCGGGYGNFVDILTDDGSTYITYGHMSEVYVNIGDKIKNGQVVGAAGCTGWSTGNHLHLEMRSGGEYGELIDPLTFIQSYVPIEEKNTETTAKSK